MLSPFCVYCTYSNVCVYCAYLNRFRVLSLGNDAFASSDELISVIFFFVSFGVINFSHCKSYKRSNKFFFDNLAAQAMCYET